ncbi:hypothetical protein [New Jersey aster yellows phytoplasma]|uniref:Uncharacterized protein n=1 Tax=New Jersey aster yellows phytoplasma TaxID=270520 RepID=A0ABX4K0F0_9MOLU|nr:hypothetical protein [New Jersey aster yellows phytoplasma]PEH36275.1 hypothetical protein BBA70_01870 [New Jersey aster yellows phytoplasma]
MLLNLYYEKLNYYNLITFDGLLIETSDFIEFVEINNGLIYNRPVFIDEFQERFDKINKNLDKLKKI